MTSLISLDRTWSCLHTWLQRRLENTTYLCIQKDGEIGCVEQLPPSASECKSYKRKADFYPISLFSKEDKQRMKWFQRMQVRSTED